MKIKKYLPPLIMWWSFIVGNILYYAIGIVLAYYCKANRGNQQKANRLRSLLTVLSFRQYNQILSPTSNILSSVLACSLPLLQTLESRHSAIACRITCLTDDLSWFSQTGFSIG